VRRRGTNGVFLGQAPILKVPSQHSAVTSKTPMWLDITKREMCPWAISKYFGD
jgi:hypothetical protein